MSPTTKSIKTPQPEPPPDRLRADDWSASRIDAAILERLAVGVPVKKWQIRDSLGINEGRIVRRLIVLRRAGHIKAVGRSQTQRAWALASWVDPNAKPKPEKRVRGKYPRPFAERYADLLI